jgi:hypothetical protein
MTRTVISLVTVRVVSWIVPGFPQPDNVGRCVAVNLPTMDNIAEN